MPNLRQILDKKTTIDLQAYGTSEGVSKEWDTRGRGKKEDGGNVTKKTGRTEVQVGHKVRYAVSFLRSISQYTGPMANAKGHVTKIEPVGDSLKVAHIDWHGEDLPGKVNVKNLTIVGSPEERYESVR